MFNHQYFISGYFPPVWFAEADESRLLPEERHGYYGNGGRNAARSQDDDGLIQIVVDKWEAIERAQAEDAKDRTEESSIKPDDGSAPGDPVSDSAQILAAPTGYSIEASIAAAEAIEAARRRAVRNDEALILILASL